MLKPVQRPLLFQKMGLGGPFWYDTDLTLTDRTVKKRLGGGLPCLSFFWPDCEKCLEVGFSTVSLTYQIKELVHQAKSVFDMAITWSLESLWWFRVEDMLYDIYLLWSIVWLLQLMSSCAYVFTRGVACRLHFELEIVGGATEYDGQGKIFCHRSRATMDFYTLLQKKCTLTSEGSVLIGQLAQA